MPLGLDQGVGTVVWSPLAGGKLGGRIGGAGPRPRTRAPPSWGDRWLPVAEEALYKVTDALEGGGRGERPRRGPGGPALASAAARRGHPWWWAPATRPS